MKEPGIPWRKYNRREEYQTACNKNDSWKWNQRLQLAYISDGTVEGNEEYGAAEESLT